MNTHTIKLAALTLTLGVSSAHAIEVTSIVSRFNEPKALIANYYSKTTGLTETVTPPPGYHIELIEIKNTYKWAPGEKDQAKSKIEISQTGKPVQILGVPNAFGHYDGQSYLQDFRINAQRNTQEISKTTSALCLIKDTGELQIKLNGEPINLPADVKTKSTRPSPLNIKFSIVSKDTLSEIVTTESKGKEDVIKISQRKPDGKLRIIKIKFTIPKDTDQSIENLVIYPGNFALLNSAGDTLLPLGCMSDVNGKFGPSTHPHNYLRSNDGAWPSENIINLVFADSKSIDGARLIFMPSLAK